MGKLTAILIVLIAFVASACQESGSGLPDKSDAFRGDEGLVITFFDDAPPDTTFPGASIEIALLLENKGSVPISCDVTAENPGGCGQFIISAREPINIKESNGLDEATKTIDNALLGKDDYATGGKAQFVSKPITVAQAEQATTVSIIASACYPYQTKLSTPVCIDTAPFNVPPSERVCELETLKFRSQGAPLAVTKIEQIKFVKAVGNANMIQPHLRVYLEDIGDGKVIARSDESFKQSCTAENINEKTEESEKGIITILKATIADHVLTCNKNKPITLSGVSKNDFIECIDETGFDRSQHKNNFVSTFDLELSYGYKTTTVKEIEVEILDAPPKITEFNVKKEVDEGSKIEITVKATDDFGLDKLIVYRVDDAGKDIVVKEKPCEDKFTCEDSLSEDPTDSKSYTYKAQAIDVSGIKSRTKIASGIVIGPPAIETFEFQTDASIGTEIGIIVKAYDENGVDKLVLLDGSDTELAEEACGSGDTCEKIIKWTVPSTPDTTYTLKVKAIDNKGNERTSEEKTGTTTGP